MADNEFIGAAPAIKDVYKLVIGNDGTNWATGDQVKITVGVRELVVTVGTVVTIAGVALAVKEAFMSDRRLDGTNPSHAATSNFGGQELGEFSELTATFDGTNTVYFVGNDAGNPITLTAAKTSTHGTATLTHPQTATGPEHYNNVLNWSLGAVPLKTDKLILRQPGLSIKHGLPANSIAFPQIEHHSTFDGQFGLAKLNVNNRNKHYIEYRRTRAAYVDTDLSGGAGNRTHSFGIGDGLGSRLINIDINHTTDGASSVNVYGTHPTPLDSGSKSLSLLLINNSGDGFGEINVYEGSVELVASGMVGALTVAASSINDVLLTDPSIGEMDVTQSGGKLTLQQTVASDIIYNLTCRGGTCYVQDVNTTGSMNIVADDGEVVYNTDGAYATLVVSGKGVFNAERDLRPFDGGTTQLLQDASFLDKYGRGSYAAGHDFIRCDVSDLRAYRIGQDKHVVITDRPGGGA